MTTSEMELWPEEPRYVRIPRHGRGAEAATATQVDAMPDIALPSDIAAAAPRGAYAAHWKRAADIALTLPLMVLVAPVIAVLGLVVLATSGGPVLHRARRVGLNGKEFTMWKLRTMVPDAEKVLEEWRTSNPVLAEAYFADYKLKDDPRITPLGRFLRKSSLDELPQLWNVLRGDMSLVGPRPVVRDELRHYGANTASFLAVRPGITGLWQTDGRNDIRYPERSWFELTYCRTFTLAMDLKILLKTLASPLRFDG